MQIVGWILYILLIGAVLFNGVVMLLSPRKWFELPPYLALRGSLSSDRLRTVHGRLEIHLAGLVFVAVAIMFITASFKNQYQTSLEANFSRDRLYSAFCIACCIPVLACGSLILFKPRWWIDRYFRGPRQISQESQVIIERGLRVLSLLFILPALYVVWRCLVLFQN
jgi:hypothetical protein